MSLEQEMSFYGVLVADTPADLARAKRGLERFGGESSGLLQEYRGPSRCNDIAILMLASTLAHIRTVEETDPLQKATYGYGVSDEHAAALMLDRAAAHDGGVLQLVIANMMDEPLEAYLAFAGLATPPNR